MTARKKTNTHRPARASPSVRPIPRGDGASDKHSVLEELREGLRDEAERRIVGRYLALRALLVQSHQHSIELLELFEQYALAPRSWLFDTMRTKAKKLRDALGYEVRDTLGSRKDD